MSKISAKELLRKYKEGTCTEEEKALIETWYNRHGINTLSFLTEAERETDINEIREFLKLESRRTRKYWPRYAAAVIILTTLSIGFYYMSKHSLNRQQVVQKVKLKQDIVPGGNKAYLTLADGTRIALGDAANGEIAKQASAVITKTAGGQIVYTTGMSAVINQSLSAYNTIETPKGGQYQVNLPDGSKVWLNAASSLRYPVVFTGNQRKVELTGEAYFEIAVDKKKPFIVHTAKQEVEVLGTHFNINSYSDEPATRTTLLEGSVKISRLQTSDSKILVPGQQAVLAENIKIISADKDESIAWKNGYFMFNDENIHSVMRKISRWYNVDIEYKGNMENKDFSGSVSRFENVSKVLAMLELTGIVHLKVEGRRILVMP